MKPTEDGNVIGENDEDAPLGPGTASPEGLTLTEHYVTLGGRKHCVCSWGVPGRPIVLLMHGLQSHAGLWDRVAPAIAERGFYVLAPDRRGHGRSEWAESYNMLDYVTDIRALLDRVSPEPVTLAGHCESTLLATLYAAAFPERVQRLVLLQFPDLSRAASAATRAALICLYVRKSQETQAAQHPIFPDAEQAVTRLLEDAPFAIPEAMARRVTPRNVKPQGEGLSWRWDPEILRFRLLFDLIDGETVSRAMQQVTAETTLIFGEQSSLVASRGGQILERVRAIAPRARQKLVPGGHYPHMEDQLSEELVRALAGEAGPSRTRKEAAC